MLTLVLPFPPSVNHYWSRSRHGGMFISRQGLDFRQTVGAIVAAHRSSWGQVEVFDSIDVDATVDLHPPDRRAYDHDNYGKALWDALVHAGVLADDKQVRSCRVELCAPIAGGACVVFMDRARGERRGWDPHVTLPEWCEGKKLAKPRNPSARKAKR